jgi:endogenous inhibitor of DNA gyrase (YacG/DUF329 family)
VARRRETDRGAQARDLCVYCRLHAVHPDWQPFCSERCQLLDLSHWLDGDYRVPGTDTDTVPDDEDGEPSRPPED